MYLMHDYKKRGFLLQNKNKKKNKKEEDESSVVEILQ
jgi:hypothetical protein